MYADIATKQIADVNEIGIAVLGSCRLQHKEEKIIDRASFAIVGDDIGKETNARSIQFC